MQQQPKQQQPQAAGTGGSGAQRKPLHQELQNAVRQLQSSIMREDGSLRDVSENYKLISRCLDTAVERTRKQPEPRNDDEWLAKKQRLANSRQALSDMFKVRKKV